MHGQFVKCDLGGQHAIRALQLNMSCEFFKGSSTDFASPCWKIVDSFSDKESSRISQAEHPGWSRVCAKVIIGGFIQTGDEVELLD